MSAPTQETAGRAAARQVVFISYARADASCFAQRLDADLRTRGGYRTWIDLRNIGPGRRFDVEIERGIRGCTRFLAVMTKHSQEEDSVCRDELVFALNEGKEVVALRVKPDREVKPTLLLARRNWVDFSQDYEEGLDALLRYLAGDEAALRQPLPTVSGVAPLDFSVEIAKYSSGFVGRQWLAVELDRWLSTEKRQAFVIVGDPGVGKSSIAAWLSLTRQDVVGIHFCTHQKPRSRDPYEFVASLVAQLHAHLPGFAEAVEKRDPQVARPTASDAFRELIVDPLSELPTPPGAKLLVVDSLEEALVQQSETLLDVLVQQAVDLPIWLRIVATTQPAARVRQQIGKLSLFELSADRPENRADVREYVRARCGRRSFPTRIDPAAIAAQVESVAEGNFLIAKLTLDALEDGSLSKADLGQLSPDLKAFYSKLFSRRFPDAAAYASDYAPLLRMLAAARAPLPFSILARSSDQSAEALNLRLRDLTSYLRVFGQGEGASYALFHRSLREWLIDPDAAGAYWCDLAEGHAQLADAGWRQFELDPSNISEYAEAHLPAHLLELRRWMKLALVVASPQLGLINQWVERGDTVGLACLNRLVEEGGLEPVHQAALATQAARIYSRRGNHSEAERRLNNALEQTSWRHGRRTRAVALHELGSLRLNRGDTPRAARLYRRALRVCVWGVPVFRDEAAANRIALATIAFTQYRWRKVVRLARRARAEAQAAGDDHHVIAADRLLGLALDDLEKYQEAESRFQAALESSRRVGAALETSRLLSLLGWFYHGQATLGGTPYARAAGCFCEALEVAESIYSSYSSVDAKLGLGWSAVGEGNTADAVAWFERAEAGLPAGAYPDLWARLRLGLAATAHQAEALKEARSQYQDLLAFAKPRDFRGNAARALVGLGAVAWHSAETEEAERAWNEARRIARRNSPRDQQLIEANIRLCRAGPTVPPR